MPSCVLFPRIHLPNTALQANPQQLLRLDGEFHRQFGEDFLAEAVDDHGDGVFRGNPALVAVENLVLADLGSRSLVLDVGGGIADLDIGKGVRAALVADEHGIALGEVAGTGRVFEHLHLAAIGVLAALGRNALGDDGAASVFADVVHLGAGVGLLPLGGDGHRVKFAD